MFVRRLPASVSNLDGIRQAICMDLHGGLAHALRCTPTVPAGHSLLVDDEVSGLATGTDPPGDAASAERAGRRLLAKPGKAPPGKKKGPPGKKPPAKGPPAKGPPGKKPPAKGPPAKGSPGKKPPAKGPPAKGPPVKKGPPGKGGAGGPIVPRPKVGGSTDDEFYEVCKGRQRVQAGGCRGQGTDRHGQLAGAGMHTGCIPALNQVGCRECACHVSKRAFVRKLAGGQSYYPALALTLFTRPLVAPSSLCPAHLGPCRLLTQMLSGAWTMSKPTSLATGELLGGTFCHAKVPGWHHWQG